jgi:hypothetical protein
MHNHFFGLVWLGLAAHLVLAVTPAKASETGLALGGNHAGGAGYEPPLRGAPEQRVSGATRGPAGLIKSSDSSTQEVSPGADAEPSLPAPSAKPSLPTYQPPLRGAPASRVGGGSRGAEAGTLAVLAPEHTGWTLQAQPTLYWYTAQTLSQPVELTIIAAEAVYPLLEKRLAPPLQAGIHALSLTELGVRLQPEVEYQWFVAWVKDPAQRSQDLVAGGTIRRVKPEEASVAGGGIRRVQPTQALTPRRGTDPAALAAFYAAKGLWYDAIEALSTQIALHPSDPHLRAQRAHLLEQVQLPAVAAHDRKASRG